MSDLISRQDAIDAIKASYSVVEDSYYNDGRNSGLFIAESIVSNLPSAERKGYWEYLYDGNYKCSNCGSWWKSEDEPCKEGLNFCPNCGADMRGEEE